MKPKAAIYNAGADNSYGHPHPDVVSLIRKSGIDLHGTNVNGTIIISTNGSTFSIKTEHNGKITTSDQLAKELEKTPINSQLAATWYVV